MEFLTARVLKPEEARLPEAGNWRSEVEDRMHEDKSLSLWVIEQWEWDA